MVGGVQWREGVGWAEMNRHDGVDGESCGYGSGDGSGLGWNGRSGDLGDEVFEV